MRKGMQKHGIEEEYKKKEDKDNYIRDKKNRKEIDNIDNLWK